MRETQSYVDRPTGILTAIVDVSQAARTPRRGSALTTRLDAG